jgi:hypothetical protein
VPNLFAAHKVVQNPPSNISAYLIESTAPDNIDDQLISYAHYDQIECLNPDTAVQQVADTLAQSDNPTLVISIHGFNNPRDIILPSYKESFDRVIRDNAINNGKHDIVCIAYRWPSERIGAPKKTAINAAPWFLLGMLAAGIVSLFVAINAHVPTWFADILGLLGVFALSVSLTGVALRMIVYFRDGYRATSFGIPDLVEIIRQIDKAVTEKELAKGTNRKNFVNLSFLAHSMGSYVVTGAVRILSDVFDTDSIPRSLNETFPSDESSKLSNIGNAFRLMRLVLVSPDIPAEALISNRANFLATSLRRFREAFLFSNEGDEVLRQISTMANYFSFPTRSRLFGYRLGNIGVLSNGYGISQGVALQHLRLGYRTLQQLYDKLSSEQLRDDLPKRFSYFDCTDCVDEIEPGVNKGVVTLARSGVANPMRPWDHLRLLISYAWKRSPDVHGGYFRSDFVSCLLYRLVCLGYNDTEAAYDGFDGLNTACRTHQIKALR